MVRKAKFQIPEMPGPPADMAAAAQGTLEMARPTSRSQVTAQVEWYSRDTHVVKGNHYPSDGSAIGPAQIELMASAYHKLVKLGDTRTALSPT